MTDAFPCFTIEEPVSTCFHCAESEVRVRLAKRGPFSSLGWSEIDLTDLTDLAPAVLVTARLFFAIATATGLNTHRGTSQRRQPGKHQRSGSKGTDHPIGAGGEAFRALEPCRPRRRAKCCTGRARARVALGIRGWKRPLDIISRLVQSWYL